jgi:hypothetical protein
MPTGTKHLTVEEEQKYQSYVGNDIPWYVRLIWVLFWIMTIWYVVYNMLPAIPVELSSPP